MGSEVASAFVSLIPSARGFGPKLSREIDGDLDKAGKSGGRRLGEGIKGTFSSSIKGIAAPLAGAFAAAGAASFFRDTIGAASDLSETVSKAKNVFGSAASSVLSWSKDSARSFGLSQEAALAATAQFGDMFSQLGLSKKAAASTSQGIVKLAADLGSFHNVNAAEVFDKIAGAMRGEYDSLQQLVPTISDATVKQEALRATNKKSVADLTEAEKATAALTLIQKSSSLAANDFAETSGGLAGQQKILSAQFADVKATVGRGLLPAMTALTSFVNVKLLPAVGQIGAFLTGRVAPALASLKAGFADLAGAIPLPILKGVGAVLGGLAAAMLVQTAATAAWAAVTGIAAAVTGLFATTINAETGATQRGVLARLAHNVATAASAVVHAAAAAAAAVWTGAQWALNAALKANPIGLVVTAIGLLIGGFVLAYKRSETFRNVVNGAFDSVKATFNAMRAAIAAGITFIVSVFNGGGGRIGAIIRGAVGVVRDQLNGMLNIAKGIINTVVGVFTGDFGRVRQGVSQALGGVIGLMTALPKRILSALGDLGGLLVNAGRELIAGLISGITKKLRDLRETMGNVAKTIGRFLPGSPVREGPLTSWNRGAAGERLMGLLGIGITRGGPAVAGALDRGLHLLDPSLRALDVSTRPMRLAPDVGGASSVARGAAAGVQQTNNIYGTDDIVRQALRQANRELAFRLSTG